MHELIAERLWIGNARDARDVSAVLEQGVAVVVDLAVEEPPIVFPREIVYGRFPLIDGEGNAPKLLQMAIQTLLTAMTGEMPTLVACGAGMSRAPLLAAAAIAVRDDLPLADALRHVASTLPHDISPSLMADVQAVLPAVRHSTKTS